MFNFFRNLIPDNYVKGYLDGYADAQAEFVHIAENLDVAYWQGYNSAMVDVSTNDDIEPMSTNDDNWYTDGITYMTKEHIETRWNELFDANPWLEGMTHSESCEFIDCCPVPEPEDWLVFNEVFSLIFLAGLHSPHTLTQDLMDNIGGTQ